MNRQNESAATGPSHLNTGSPPLPRGIPRSTAAPEINRRAFLGAVAAGGFLAGPASLCGGTRSAELVRAAVIGHTGRGDYGHGWENIFANRPGIQVVALADPDPVGRARAAGKIGAQRCPVYRLRQM